MDNNNKVAARMAGKLDSVLDLVIPFLTDSRDRDSASRVSNRWYETEALTRKHVTIALCYTTTPEKLSKRFKHLESLKLKGKPRVTMVGLVSDDWGGYATRWVEEIERSFRQLTSVHFRRMIVADADLGILANRKRLQVLKLHQCSGFSTDGLHHITSLKTLFLEDSMITDKDGQWLHEIAEHHTALESLNFYLTNLRNVEVRDLEQIGRRCPLISLKMSNCHFNDLIPVFEESTLLEEFAGGFNQAEIVGVRLPPMIRSLGPSCIEATFLPVVYPVASRLKELDLTEATLDTECHCQLLQRCPNLEILRVMNVIGDRGVEVIAQCCKLLRRLRIERGDDDREGDVSHRGLISLSQGCTELEYMAAYVSDITNESLGTHLRKLVSFRLMLLGRHSVITDLPLDEGVRSLLIGCSGLRTFFLFLREGGLTDAAGLRYIGQHSPNVRWMVLASVGASDTGLLALSRGCPSLQKLEIWGTHFTELAIAIAAAQLKSLRYLWVRSLTATSPIGLSPFHLFATDRKFWNIELTPLESGQTQLMAYHSLAGEREDFPPSVFPLRPL